MSDRPPSSYPGTCRDCKRRRPVYPIQRQGGGSYRRGHRWYSSSICLECAVGNMRYASTNRSQPRSGFPVGRLAQIAAVDPVGLHLVQDWRERCANHAAIQAAQRGKVA